MQNYLTASFQTSWITACLAMTSLISISLMTAGSGTPNFDHMRRKLLFHCRPG